MSYVWLSFCDDVDGRFIGGCFVRAESFIEAVQVSHALGINPGGDVSGALVKRCPYPDELVGRLLSRSEIDAADRDVLGDSFDEVCGACKAELAGSNGWTHTCGRES